MPVYQPTQLSTSGFLVEGALGPLHLHEHSRELPFLIDLVQSKVRRLTKEINLDRKGKSTAKF